MESNIVIKVKYGETLRRFTACVDENEQLELDMGALRVKIRGLFNLPPDADLTLTYIDVDGDVVTLVDDADLHDVMRQSLNPFRINVLLSNDRGGRSYTRSSGSSTPMRSPRVHHPLPNINTCVSEILKSAPEPFRETLSKLSLDRASTEILKSAPEPVREALSKLSLDLASKAASSSPLLAELVDCVSKMGQSYLNLGSHFQAGESSTQNEASESPIDPSAAEDSKKDDSKMEVLPNAQFSDQNSKSILKVDIVNMTRGVATPVAPAPAVEIPVAPSPASVDLNLDIPADSVPSGTTTSNVLPVASKVPSGNNRKEEMEKGSDGHRSEMPVGFGAHKGAAFMKHCHRAPSKITELGGGLTKRLSSEIKNSSSSHFGLNPFNECPFIGMPLPDNSPSAAAAYPRMHPFKRSYNHSDGMGGIFHRGVRCDGCGVHPITGPRFKSQVKEDYDLCSICFAEMGNESDYIRLDRPLSYRHPLSFKGLPDPHSRVRPPALPHLLRGCGVKPGRPKLDSRFSLDVNVLDGTMMAPSTPFTKIWRMRNNGSLVWPQGTQLVWIGGDKFSDAVSHEIEIPVDGVPVDKELDIAVDFRAPEQPGRYTSYWRMASPTGQKFGQRVWVLIQVDVSVSDCVCDSFHGLNLNLPPDSNGSRVSEIIDVNVKPVVDVSLPQPSNSTVTLTPMVDEQPNRDQELNFPINDTLLVGNGVTIPIPLVVPSSVSYPIINGVPNHIRPLFPSSVSYPIINGGSNPIPPAVPSSVSYPIPPVVPSSVSDSIPPVVPSSVSYPIPPAVPSSMSYPIPPAVPSSVSYPIIDFSEVAPAAPSISLAPAIVEPIPTEEVGGNNDVEQTLLKELEEMGFKQVDLNKEILRMNEYNLEQSVDDLCGVAEWDPILEELQEMGFCDEETNRRLLKKNNGSIKRVVMDLIAGEKA